MTQGALSLAWMALEGNWVNSWRTVCLWLLAIVARVAPDPVGNMPLSTGCEREGLSAFPVSCFPVSHFRHFGSEPGWGEKCVKLWSMWERCFILQYLAVWLLSPFLMGWSVL